MNAAIAKNMALNPLINNAEPNVDNPDEPPLSDDGGTGGDGPGGDGQGGDGPGGDGPGGDIKISNYE